MKIEYDHLRLYIELLAYKITIYVCLTVKELLKKQNVMAIVEPFHLQIFYDVDMKTFGPSLPKTELSLYHGRV